MRRNVRRHADGDAACPVDQKVRKFCRHNDGLGERAVVVVAEVDRFLVEVIEQRMRRLLQTAFRVTLGRRGVAVDGTEVALAVDQRQAERPVLRHASQRIVDRHVAMRMVFTHHVTGDAGTFDVFLVPVDAQLRHAIEDAPVHGLQAVTDVRKRAADDDAHRVIEIRPLHFLHDGDGLDAWRELPAAWGCLFSQNRSRSLCRITERCIAERLVQRQFEREF